MWAPESLKLWHQDTGVSFMYQRKTNPELMSYITYLLLKGIDVGIIIF